MFLTTKTELKALLLEQESDQAAQSRKFNVLLRDDKKAFPNIL